MSTFTDEYTSDIPRGLSSRYLKEQTAPQARWQAPENIMKSAALSYDPEKPGDKILVGAMDDKLIGVSDETHILTMAGSRSGKSVTLTANLLSYRGSVLATDPKGELASMTARRRAQLGQKVFVLDPFKVARGTAVKHRACFNPLSVLELKSPTIIEDAALIADALVIAGGKDPHWDECAKNFIEGLILHVATASEYEGKRTLVTVRGLIRVALKTEEREDGEVIFPFEEEMAANAENLLGKSNGLAVSEAIEGAAVEFFEKSDNERASVLSTVRRHTKVLEYASMRDVLSGHDFDLADLKRDPSGVTIYLCLPASRMGLCSRWLRIFVNLLLDAMEREETKPKAPVLLCLDEFPVLGYMSQLENAAGQIASFGVKLWVILQDWGQGKALYNERWESFVANAGIIQCFANYDLATTEYLSKKLGKTLISAVRDSEVGAEQARQGLTGKSEALELHDLATPEEIARQFSRKDRFKRQLVIWAGFHPMILQRVEYFDERSVLHKHFAGKYDPR